MKTYNELVNQVREELANGGKRSFSRELFNDLTLAYMNDVDNVTTIAKTKNGEMVTEEINVPQNFRKMIMKILLDFGVDKQEAEKIMTNEYQFKNLDALYEVASETILNYAGTGKKFNFITKPDLQVSLLIDEFEECVKLNKRPGAPDEEAKEVKKAGDKPV